MNRALLIALWAGAVWMARPDAALAGDGVFLVRGSAPSDIRAAASSATREALRQARWNLPARSFTEQEVETVASCLGKDKPWACISAVLRDHKVDRVAIISVDRKAAKDGSPLVQLTTRVVIAEEDLAYGDEQYCERCNAERINAAAATLATKVLGRVYLNSNRTSLEVMSSPAGAKVLVDGTVMGASNLVFDILPGRHSLTISLPGYREVTRTLDVVDGQAASVNARLEPEEVMATAAPEKLPTIGRAPETETIVPRWVAPSMMAAGAVAMVVGGGLLYADVDQPEGEVQRQYNVSGRSLGFLIAGAAAAGGGFYLWRWPPTREHSRAADSSISSISSSVSASPLRGGGLAVFAIRF